MLPDFILSDTCLSYILLANEKGPEIILMTTKKVAFPSLAHPVLLLELLQQLLKIKKKTNKTKQKQPKPKLSITVFFKIKQKFPK